MSIVTRPLLLDLLARLDAAFARPGRLLLVGETTLAYEGWRGWIDEITFTASVAPDDRPAFDEALREATDALSVAVWEEDPADIIPLPDGFGDRHRSIAEGPTQHLSLAHFDPYSVAFRYIARGDEPDYHLVLTLLDEGWITLDEMEAKLKALLPRFSMQTIQQDPAEFRRKYKGLLQMAHAVRPGTTHRPTPA